MKATGASGPSPTGAGRRARASGRSSGSGRSSTGSARSSQEHGPDAVALEESFVGADARIALFVGQARGAALVAAASAGVACTEYAPARVKQAVCGYGRADKGQVSRMVQMLLALDAEPPTSHEADALAVAICHASMPPLARLAS